MTEPVAIGITLFMVLGAAWVLIHEARHTRRFCKRCGRRLEWRYDFLGFDQHSGKRRYEQGLTCPESKTVGRDCMPPPPSPLPKPRELP